MIGWQHKPIGKVVKRIATGSTPSTSHPEFFGEQIPWFTPGDIGSTRNLVESSRHITEKALSDGKAKLFEEQTLLVTCIGNIGRVGVLQVPASSNQQITALRFNDEVDVYYAYYWFIAHQHKLESQTTQAVVPILNNARLKQIDFFYPPLPEQKRITAILAKADRLRRLRRTARDLSDTYLQSVFLEMFGDESKTEHVTIQELMRRKVILKMQDGNHGEAYPRRSDFVSQGIPFLTATNVIDDQVFLDSAPRITPEKASQLRIGWIEPNDVLLSHNATVGRVGIVPQFTGKVVIGTSLTYYRLNHEVLTPAYFAQVLRSRPFQGQMEQIMKQTTRNQVPITRQRELLIPEPPPLSLQQQFARIVHKFERLRAQQREAQGQTEHLFQTLLHRAFRGEL